MKSFLKGDFVVEYSGELIDIRTAKDLETKYSLDASKGCYIVTCISSTKESSIGKSEKPTKIFD